MAAEFDEEALRADLAGQGFHDLTARLEDEATAMYNRTVRRVEDDDGRQNQDDQALIEAVILLARHNATMT